VEDAVLVVVGIRTAVGVLEAVLVLGLVRALVDRIGDPVAVVVRIRAAVGVFEAILVLGLVRALVDIVGDPVAVGVALARPLLVMDPDARRALLRTVAAELLAERQQRFEVVRELLAGVAALLELAARIDAQVPAAVAAELEAEPGVRDRVAILEHGQRARLVDLQDAGADEQERDERVVGRAGA